MCVCVFMCASRSLLLPECLFFFFSLAFCIRECGSALGEL